MNHTPPHRDPRTPSGSLLTLGAHLIEHDDTTLTTRFLHAGAEFHSDTFDPPPR